jgi:ABC-type multidrug transport system fused ATPase/permease subunit
MAFLLDFLANTLVIFQSLLLAQTISLILKYESLRSNMLGLGQLSPEKALTLFVVLMLGKLVIDYFRLRIRGTLSEQFAQSLRVKLFHHFIHGDGTIKTGGVLLRLSGDLSSVQRLLSRGVLQFVADLLLLIMGMAFIGFFHTGLMLLEMGLAALGWLALKLVNYSARGAEMYRRNRKANLMTYIHQVLQERTEIQEQGLQSKNIKKFGLKAEKLSIAAVQYQRIAAMSEALPYLLVQLFLLASLWAAWFWEIPGNTIFPIILILMAWRVALTRLFKADLVWKKGMLSLKKISESIQ